MNQKNTLNKITISRAKIHNLKTISLSIPKNTLTVITGPSGSGKSSLAFDTIYAEGQRRYIESLSSYARQFLEQFAAADVDSITGLSPTLAIDQKSVNKNPRSTVGTITEIYDYLRILFTRIGKSYCPECGEIIEKQSAEQIVNSILKKPIGTKVQLLAPIIRNRKGEHKEEITNLLSMGLSRARLNGEIISLDSDFTLSKTKAHTLEVIIDRILLKDGVKSRLTDSVEQALKLGKGMLTVLLDADSGAASEFLYNENHMCLKCDIGFPELSPNSFSFNSPLGACSICNGLGFVEDFQDDLIITDPSRSIDDGGIPLLTKRHVFLYKMIACIAEQEDIDLNMPIKNLPKKFMNTILNGNKKIYTFSFTTDNSTFNFTRPFIGIHAWLRKRYFESASEKVRSELQQYLNTRSCKACKSHRLNPFALSTKILDHSIMEICDLSVADCFKFISKLGPHLSSEDQQIAIKPLKEIKERLGFLLNVGLSYLTLNRSANTLAGGEGQRIRLATQIGSSLSGVIYVLDEPSIGLHPRDNTRLIQTLISLRDLGNTVLVVEHDEETIRTADHIIDMGPGAGIHGGEVVAQGELHVILSTPNSPTGKFLSGKESIPIPENTRSFSKFINLYGAKRNNLLGIDIKFPLNAFVCITGVSGSGKSTLVHEILVPAIFKQGHYYGGSGNRPYSSIDGNDAIDTVIELDQTPIGRTPKSNPATYSGVFDHIRNVFAESVESKVRGYKPGRFSFNVKGGRCESCEGNGVKKIEMHFLPDVFITCHACAGKRYNQETLSVLYRGKNIHDVLNMTIEEAYSFFKNHNNINKILSTLISVGLGYMRLGQPATTLSGGEAQRLKLASELARPTKAHCLYVLDEPTTGLHFADIKILLESIHKLVDRGHSVLIIEHNLDVIKTADYIIDLGPEGGDQGGNIVAVGTPKEIANNPKSHTGAYLKKLFTQSILQGR
ncbi:MAG: excinuclease ABC subunit UvrA [Oligoflexia bacterium]|nr:excinuclease ABC subunit UvrA [Oligoflexia bacterium]